MIQSTIERLLPRIPLECMMVVTNAGQSDVINLELQRKGWQGIRLVLQPEGRNAAATVGLAAALLGKSHRLAWRLLRRTTLLASQPACWRP